MKRYDQIRFNNGSVFRGLTNGGNPVRGLLEDKYENRYFGDYDSSGNNIYKWQLGGEILNSGEIIFANRYKNELQGYGILLLDNHIVFGDFFHSYTPSGTCVVVSGNSFGWYDCSFGDYNRINQPSVIPSSFGDYGDRLKGFVVHSFSGNKYCGFVNYNNDYEGFGVFEWADGDKYIGLFHNGKQHGRGLLIKSNAIQFGKFTDGQIDDGVCYIKSSGGVVNMAYCTPSGIVFPSGDVYVGDFDDNYNYTGKGAYYWASGKSYEGYFKDGIIFGRGTYTYSSGRTDTGVWVKNNLVKPGTDTYRAICSYCDGPKKNKKFGKFLFKLGVKALCIYLGISLIDLIPFDFLPDDLDIPDTEGCDVDDIDTNDIDSYDDSYYNNGQNNISFHGFNPPSLNTHQKVHIAYSGNGKDEGFFDVFLSNGEKWIQFGTGNKYNENNWVKLTSTLKETVFWFNGLKYKII